MVKCSKLVVFEDKKIRRVWYNNEWYFSIVDIVEALTNSSIPRRYWSDLKIKLSREGFQLYEKIVQVKLQSDDGKYYETDCANTENIFRLIQSIPSPKAEPFKQWLAMVGYERVQEIENPELAQERARKYYQLKGYNEEWINLRLRGIAIRQELTKEWKNRSIEGKEFSILTIELNKAIFDKTVDEHKKFKKLTKQNLRDHMDDWESILTVLGEKATADITIAKNSHGFAECKNSTQKAGAIARNTRKQLEQETGKSIVSGKNYLNVKERKKIEEK